MAKEREDSDLGRDARETPEEETAQTRSGKRLRKGEKKNSFLQNYGYLIATVAVMLALFRGVFLLGFVTSGSMESTLPTHSVFLSWHLSYLVGDPVPERGDIILFHSDELDSTLVKRVVGLPGDTITFEDGYTYVNGQQLEEDYLPVQGITEPQNPGDTFTVPEGCVFMLGDHRDRSLDSRYWQDPYVPLSNLRARALVDFSLWPGNTWIGVRRVG